MRPATTALYLEREKEIRETIRLIEGKQEFDGTYRNPKIFPQIARLGLTLQSLKQFLEGTQQIIHHTVPTRQAGLNLSTLLSWKHPKWCHFNQPSESCEENEGFSVTCQVVTLERERIAIAPQDRCSLPAREKASY